MLIRPQKQIELKDVASIQVKIDENNNFSIMNLLKDRDDLNEYYKIPLTSELEDLLASLVRELVVGTLVGCNEVWRSGDESSGENLVEITERHFKQLFEQPNVDVTLIEERVNHQLRSEIAEDAREFLLDVYHCLPKQEREDFLNQFIDHHVIHVYFDPYEERFRFSFPNESDLRGDDDTFYCGYVALEEQDTQNIFN